MIFMKKTEKLKYYIDSLCVYDLNRAAVYDDDATFLNYMRWMLCDYDKEATVENYSKFFRYFAANGSLKEYLSMLVLTDDNVFTKAAAAGRADELPKAVLDGVKSDLKKLEELASLTPEDIINNAEKSQKEILLTMPRWETGSALPPLGENWADKIDELKAFHKENGYGSYVQYSAFGWRDGELVPINSLDKIRLSDLKNYDRQRKQILDNTLAFLEGYPANNILLYGDRGTGKSSTVHALLNEYKNRGLRMIEISKGDIGDLSLIREMIHESPMKFIIFIDDLSFDTHDDSFSELKAALEGSLSGRQGNTLIYATSNRRHLIKESFADRENDVHRSDTMQEEISLSDRFGLSVYFDNPDKNGYLDIVEKIAKDRDIKADRDKLLNSAEGWARRKGGRSPRCARQFVDYVEACEKRNIEW